MPSEKPSETGSVEMENEKTGIVIPFPKRGERTTREIVNFFRVYLRDLGAADDQAEFVAHRLEGVLIKLEGQAPSLDLEVPESQGEKIKDFVHSITSRYILELALTYLELWDAGVRQ